MKKCSNSEYDFSNFYKDKSSKDGYRCDCKNCAKLYRDNNKDYQKEYTNLQPLCSKINRDIKKNNIEYGFI